MIMIFVVSVFTSVLSFGQKTSKYEKTEYNIGFNYEQDEFSILSKDMIVLTFNYSFLTTIEEANIPFIHNKFGPYYKKYCQSLVRSLIRENFGQYTVEEIVYSKRDLIITDISNKLSTSLEEYKIIFEKLLIESIEIPPELKASMEEVVIAQQEVIAKRYELEKVKIELEIQAAKNKN